MVRFSPYLGDAVKIVRVVLGGAFIMNNGRCNNFGAKSRFNPLPHWSRSSLPSRWELAAFTKVSLAEVLSSFLRYPRENLFSTRLKILKTRIKLKYPKTRRNNPSDRSETSQSAKERKAEYSLTSGVAKIDHAPLRKTIRPLF